MRQARLAALAAILFSPTVAAAQASSSCSLPASSFADSILNPPRGEDTDFFVNTGGVPGVVFLLDTSASMIRLPPDGASRGWGSFENPVSPGKGLGFGCYNSRANGLRFASSCGATIVEGKEYTDGTDWAAATDASGAYCPYFYKAGLPMKADRRGFDPDFYLDGTQFPKFFLPTRVYHDAIVTEDSSRDGWSDWSTSPQAELTVPEFCSRASWSPEQQVSCSTCMASQGYWFDGSYLSWSGPSCGNTSDCSVRNLGTCVHDVTGLEWTGANDGTAHCRFPNVWFSGNFLNFQPPKFIIARKVTKDILANLKPYRLSMYGLDGVGGGAKMWREPNPPCGSLNSPSAYVNNRNNVRDILNGVQLDKNNNKLSFTGPSPLAEALLDIGHLHATYSLDWFKGTPYDDSAFQERSGRMERTVCFACQRSSVLLITDGGFTHDGLVPGVLGWNPITKKVADATGNYAGLLGYNLTTLPSTDCASCATAAEAADTTLAPGTCEGQQLSGACTGAKNAIDSWLPKAAWYLHNMDFRDDDESGADGYKMTDKQSVDVYTIALGTTGNATEILKHTAEAGGGLFNGGVTSGSTVNATELKQAILAALEDVNTRAVAFGSASLSTLQAAASQSVLVPRFVPSRKAHWEGHLFAFDLWSEFTGGCSVPLSGPSGPANGDYDCDGKCTSVFLRDKNLLDPAKPGDFIQEDATGAFMKNDPPDRAACGSGNRCSSCATPSTTQAANPFWDAGARLSPENPPPDGNYKEWRNRKIYTVVDDASPKGKFTSADSLVLLADNDATVTRLLPYLNAVGNSRLCAALADRLSALKNPEAATIRAELAQAPAQYLACGRVIVQYVMGADVFNERRCATYGPGSYCSRPYQLGDVFHSSPVEVWPPLASDGLLCSRGLHPQCLPSLFSQSIPNPSTTGKANAYDDYAKSTNYKHRNKFALVGANDGMLHAIVTGTWQPAPTGKNGGDDPRTPQREDLPPYEGYHDEGTGEEIWAFIPPDLLPKLHLLLGGTHHFFVDGTPMVRDVWIDGWLPNRLGGGTNADGVRAGNEFHTVAVVGERRGGTKYFALDVTDAGNDLNARPRFLWIYPQPDDPEQLQFGETYAEFVPTPPPIGPVRIDTGSPCTNANHGTFQTAAGATRCFEERWIAFLSGGFDPQYTKGRGVHMVDIGSGDELFDFSQPPGAASGCDATKDPRCHLNYPVAAPVGMMMWGKQTNFLSSAAVDGYFDTATFGDTGGQLWVLRFSDPGIIDSDSGKVENWFGARVFQMNAAATPASGVDFCTSQPFFHITANLPLQANGLYRVLAGTGDRFNLLDPRGGQCSPDNLRACIQKGCTVTIDDGVGGPGAVYGVETLLGTDSYHMAHGPHCGSFDEASYTALSTAEGAAVCTGITAKLDRVEISCPSTLSCSGAAEISTKRMSMSCQNGHCVGVPSNMGYPIDLNVAADNLNWYFSLLVFENAGARQIFSDQAGAEAYDAARLTQTDLVSINAHDAAPATNPLAAADSRGWKFYFDHGRPTSTAAVSIDGESYYIWRADERIASSSAVEASCTFWNTMQVAVPSEAVATSSSCPVNSPCKAGKKQVSYLYGANPGTGGLCLYVDSALARSQRTEAVVPPHIGKLVAYVSSGQVSFGLTSVRVPQGGSNISLGEAQDVSSLVEWVPVDREMHDCRHGAPPYVDGKGTPPASCK